MDQGDEEGQQRIPITEVREWGDPGLNELITPFTEPSLDRLNLDAQGNGVNDQDRPSMTNIR